MMRVVLFLITNMSVMLLLSIVMMFIDIQFSSLLTLLSVSGIIGFGGSIISLLMSKHIALSSVNGKILEHASNEVERWLLKVIYDQSNKLGIVMPQVAVYDACDMNAFATGAKKDSALIAVSTGLLQSMTYDEIEAVVAHEMSHISNGDMVTMTLIQGVINTFVIFISRILAQFIYSCISYLSSSSYDSSEHITIDDGNNINDTNNDFLSENDSSIYYFISMILESVFGVLASMVILWFSRYREFYADAGSAKLVGSDKMIAALEKLKFSYEPKESNLVSSFCVNGYRINSKLNELFMSHPSLDRRIQALHSGCYLNKSSFFHINF